MHAFSKRFWEWRWRADSPNDLSAGSADYGIDRPDLRFEMKLKDLSDIAADSQFQVFTSVVKKGIVKGFCAPGGGDKYSRSDIEKTLTQFVGDFGAKGLAWLKVAPKESGEGLELKSSIAKFFTDAQQQEIIGRFDASAGDLVLMVADSADVVNKALAPLRVRLGKELGLCRPDQFEFVWVVDFPLFEWNPDEKRYDSLHHPFTCPVPEVAQTPNRSGPHSFPGVRPGCQRL